MNLVICLSIVMYFYRDYEINGYSEPHSKWTKPKSNGYGRNHRL